MEDQEIVREFLLESNENLERLDFEMVQLEREPDNGELLGSVFRTIHTIKGTCGFLGFSRLEALAHVSEDILSQLRNGQRKLDAPLAGLILESVDAIKRMLVSIEANGGEGEAVEADLIARLKQARDGNAPAPQPAPALTPPAAPITRHRSPPLLQRQVPPPKPLYPRDQRSPRPPCGSMWGCSTGS